jgi:hypothetical protein
MTAPIRTFETSGPAPEHGPCLCPWDVSLRETTCRPCGAAACPSASPEHYAGDTCAACGWVRVLICDVCGDEDAPPGQRVCDGCRATEDAALRDFARHDIPGAQ